MNDVIKHFFKMESAGGIILVVAAAIAMFVANSPLNAMYQSVLHIYILGMSVSHWINDGLMAIFFLLIGPVDDQNPIDLIVQDYIVALV